MKILNRYNSIVLYDGDIKDIQRGAVLICADLGGAVLGGADLSGADLSGADLRDANLRGADLSGADLSGADLRRADLGGACFRGADLRDANLRGADLSGADLGCANLRGADLSGADFRGADLRGAILSGAVLRDADLSGAVLRDGKIHTFKKFEGLYRYQIWSVLFTSGRKMIRMGCLFYTLERWNEIGILESNQSEYPNNRSELSLERQRAFMFAKDAVEKMKL